MGLFGPNIPEAEDGRLRYLRENVGGAWVNVGDLIRMLDKSVKPENPAGFNACLKQVIDFLAKDSVTAR